MREAAQAKDCKTPAEGWVEHFWDHNECDCFCESKDEELKKMAKCKTPAENWVEHVWDHRLCDCFCESKEVDKQAETECKTDTEGWTGHEWFPDLCQCECKKVDGKYEVTQQAECEAVSPRQWDPDLCTCRCNDMTLTEEKRAKENCEGGPKPGKWNNPSKPCDCLCPPNMTKSIGLGCACTTESQLDCASKKKTNPYWSYNNKTCNCDCTRGPEGSECERSPGVKGIIRNCECVCPDAGKTRTTEPDACGNVWTERMNDDCTAWECDTPDGSPCVFDCSDPAKKVYGRSEGCACKCEVGKVCKGTPIGDECAGEIQDDCQCRCPYSKLDCTDPAYPDFLECECDCYCVPEKHGAYVVNDTIKCKEKCHMWDSATCSCQYNGQDWDAAHQKRLDACKAALEKAYAVYDGAQTDIDWYKKFGDVIACNETWSKHGGTRRGPGIYNSKRRSLWGTDEDRKACAARFPCENGHYEQLVKANDLLNQCIEILEKSYLKIVAEKCPDENTFTPCDDAIDLVCELGGSAYNEATYIHAVQTTVLENCEEGPAWDDYDPSGEVQLPFPDDHTSGLDGLCGGDDPADAAGLPGVIVEIRDGT